MSQPSAAVRRIFRSAGKSEITSRDLGVLLAEIPGMSDRIRRYVKTFYGFVGGDLNDPVRAAAVLGPRVVLDVTIQHALVEFAMGLGLPNALYQTFWSECIRRALCARLIADRLEGVPVDTAFGAGLSSEFGVITMLNDNGKCLHWVREIRHLLASERLEAEKAALGMNRLEAFVGRGRTWNLPENLLYVVAHCENTSRKHPPGAAELCMTVVAANQLGQILSSKQPGNLLESWVARAGALFDIDPEAAWEIIEEVLGRTPEVAEALGVPVERQPTVEELCAGLHNGADPEGMSREELLEWTRILLAESERSKDELSALREDVDEAHNRDFLTRLPNHNRMLAVLGDAVAECCRSRESVSIVLLDIDGFNAVNAHYGYGVGDRVLGEAAKVLTAVWADADVVARVGPDAFIGVFRAEERDGQLFSERARAAIEAMGVVVDAQSRVRLTASVYGVSRIPAAPDASQALLAELFKLSTEVQGATQNRSHW